MMFTKSENLGLGIEIKNIQRSKNHRERSISWFYMERFGS